MLHARAQHLRRHRRRPRGSVGTIVVHVAFDYRTLPFITSQSPYFERVPAQPGRGRRAKGAAAATSTSPIYGWGLSRSTPPAGRRGRSPTTLFERIYDPREPFWTRLAARRRHATTSTSPTIAAASTRSATRCSTLFDHLVHLAELTTLAGGGVRARADRHRALHARSRASARASAARCCARSAPASTASCFSRSCSRRSSRC